MIGSKNNMPSTNKANPSQEGSSRVLVSMLNLKVATYLSNLLKSTKKTQYRSQ